MSPTIRRNTFRILKFNYNLFYKLFLNVYFRASQLLRRAAPRRNKSNGIKLLRPTFPADGALFHLGLLLFEALFAINRRTTFRTLHHFAHIQTCGAWRMLTNWADNGRVARRCWFQTQLSLRIKLIMVWEQSLYAKIMQDEPLIIFHLL